GAVEAPQVERGAELGEDRSRLGDEASGLRSARVVGGQRLARTGQGHERTCEVVSVTGTEQFAAALERRDRRVDLATRRAHDAQRLERERLLGGHAGGSSGDEGALG